MIELVSIFLREFFFTLSSILLALTSFNIIKENHHKKSGRYLNWAIVAFIVGLVMVCLSVKNDPASWIFYASFITPSLLFNLIIVGQFIKYDVWQKHREKKAKRLQKELEELEKAIVDDTEGLAKMQIKLMELPDNTPEFSRLWQKIESREEIIAELSKCWEKLFKKLHKM